MAECPEPTSSATTSANITSNLLVKIEDLVTCRSVERQRLEFKASWNNGPTKFQVIKTISAFANDFYNDNGGYIVIGVAEPEEDESVEAIVLPPVGINPNDIERIQKQVSGACKSLISPPYSPILSPEYLQEKLVLVIWAQASDDRPHKARVSQNGEYHYFIRKGPETTKANDKEIKSLLENSSKIPFDDRMARLEKRSVQRRSEDKADEPKSEMPRYVVNDSSRVLFPPSESPKLQFKKSIKHREKIQTLETLEVENMTKLGPPVKCFVQEKRFSLGDGCNGTSVYLGILEDGSEVAVKRMLKDKCEDVAENEMTILSLINTKKSPFIVSYRHFLSDNIFVYLIVDLCEQTLDEYVRSAESISDLQKNGPRMIKEILTGLEFLHDHRILHRDLKPLNILVDVEGHMRLADFGMSRVLNENETTFLTNAKGTKDWMAPEVIENRGKKGKGRFKKKSDIHPAGMIAFFILTKGEHPFGSTLDRMTNIVNGNPVNVDNLDLDARQFVSRLICHKLDDRPYAHEALLLPFLVIGKVSLSDINQHCEEEMINAPVFGEECVGECCLDFIAGSLGTHWEHVGRRLGVKQAEIDHIHADWSQQKEHGFQVLLTWKKCRGNEALVSKLTNTLKQLQLSDVANELLEHFHESHDNGP